MTVLHSPQSTESRDRRLARRRPPAQTAAACGQRRPPGQTGVPRRRPGPGVGSRALLSPRLRRFDPRARLRLGAGVSAVVDSPATSPVAVVSLMVSFVDSFDVCVPTVRCRVASRGRALRARRSEACELRRRAHCRIRGGTYRRRLRRWNPTPGPTNPRWSPTVGLDSDSDGESDDRTRR